MKIILLKSIPKLGVKDDIVEVAPAYARNFLIPKGLAAIAAPQAMLELAEKRRRQEKKQEVKAKQNERLRKILEGQTILVRSGANPEGKLFGGVDAKEIAKNIAKRKKIEVDYRQIILPHHLKTLGKHEVVLKLGAGEEVGFGVEVARESD